MTDNHTPEAGTPADGAPAPDDFSHLVAEANALEGGPPVPGTPEAEASDAKTLAMQIEGNTELIEFGFQCLGPLMPERYADRYGQRERASIAKAYTVLAIKRGWDMGEFFEKWGAELALVMAVAGPALPVFMGDMKRRKQGDADVSDREATH